MLQEDQGELNGELVDDRNGGTNDCDATRGPRPAVAIPHVGWNLGVLTTDVSFFSIGMACLDMNAVMPLMLERLGASGPAIGALSALRFLAFSALQMVVVYCMHGRGRQKPFLGFIAAITRFPLLALPWFLWHSGDSRSAQATALLAAFIIIIVWGLGDGLGYVPWMEIVARAFDPRTRGRFFAVTQTISGVAGIVVAAGLVRTILHSPALPYPHNYAVLAAISAIMFHVSLSGILLIREPPPPRLAPAPRPALLEYMRRLPRLVAGNPTFARLAGIQLLVGFGAAAQPFYVLYATRHFHLPDEWAGTYQVLLAISVVGLTPVWSVISERANPAVAVRALSLVCLASPVAACLLGQVSPWAFGLVFLTVGGSLGWGMWIVFNHFLLDHVSAEERPVFVALLNLLFMPSAIYPFLGGLLVPKAGFPSVAGVPILFLITSAVVGLGVVLSWRLAPPRSESAGRT